MIGQFKCHFVQVLLDPPLPSILPFPFLHFRGGGGGGGGGGDYIESSLLFAVNYLYLFCMSCRKSLGRGILVPCYNIMIVYLQRPTKILTTPSWLLSYTGGKIHLGGGSTSTFVFSSTATAWTPLYDFRCQYSSYERPTKVLPHSCDRCRSLMRMCRNSPCWRSCECCNNLLSSFLAIIASFEYGRHMTWLCVNWSKL